MNDANRAACSGSGTARHSRQSFRSHKHAAMLIKRTFGVESRACNVFDQLAICFKKALSVPEKCIVSQRLMGHSARHRVADIVRHQEPNAVLF